MKKFVIFCLFLSWILFGCSDTKEKKIASPEAIPKKQVIANEPLFTALSPEYTNVGFMNPVTEDDRFSPFVFINTFSGGGVSIGDINNDGLQDIYLTGNQVSDRLFLNDGDMKFIDITVHSGANGGEGWSSGVTMADVNGDRLLDIYVSRGFMFNDEWRRENILYINNGDLTFTDKAKEYGLNDDGLSVQSTFFDYDLDGDLDLYVGNHPWEYNLNLDYSMRQISNPQMKNSDHLYRNNGNGTFTDVTVSSGILNFGFMLGLVIGDYNNDGWPDIYVAVDHKEPDKLYLNNKNGTFTNIIDEALKHTSKFSMGVDMADFNNDGHLDLLNVDMMAQDNFRQKSQMASMNPSVFWLLVDKGYGHQYMRNMLHVNNGNGKFSEVGQMAGISKTDWSWSALFADFDNDGMKDIYITNGYPNDIKDNDFLSDINHENNQLQTVGKAKLSKVEWAQRARRELSSTKLSNYYFENQGSYKFVSKATEYGLGNPGFSNGAAYGDLDNDGDLDLVVNNLQSVASIYKNNTTTLKNNGNLRIKLVGEGLNTLGLGSKVTLKIGDEIQYQELTLTRGFQSSMEPILHFGIGQHSMVDEVKIEWPDGRVQIKENLTANTNLVFNQSEASLYKEASVNKSKNKLFTELSSEKIALFRHKENEYDDYEKEILLPHKMSKFGPGITVGDVNGDGAQDFYVGGASGQSGALFVEVNGSSYEKTTGGPWEKDRLSEDISALFFDADGDNDLDLYVVSGSNEVEIGDPKLRDRLYINNGQGNFVKSKDKLPEMLQSGGCVVAADYDGDDDLDLFIGGRQIPGKYPLPPKSFLLRNDNGRFIDVTQESAPQLQETGMVTSAIWTDFDNDGLTDLIVVGEWMPISFYKNNGSSFDQVNNMTGLDNTVGWWNRIIAGDFDNDGDEDYVVGNLGLNYKYHATKTEPFHLYYHDFDNEGNLDIVLGQYNEGICYPVRGRECSSQQMPMIKNRFPSFKEYASSDLRGIYGNELDKALHYAATTFESSYIENRGDGSFIRHELPIEAQFSTVNGIIPYDYDNDGKLDILLSGNLWSSEVETGRADAGTGVVLKGDGHGAFQTLPLNKTGFFTELDVKDIQMLNENSDNPRILVANNNAPIQIFELSR